MNKIGSVQDASGLYDRLRNGNKGWSKYNGDVWTRIVKSHMEGQLGSGLKVTEPNVFLKGLGTEIDLLVVRSAAEPEDYTSSYDPAQVRAALEVKAVGIYAAKKDLPSRVLRMKETFDSITKVSPGVRCAYLTLAENTLRYLPFAVDGLRPTYPTFCFQDSGSKRTPRPEDWDSFNAFVRSLKP